MTQVRMNWRFDETTLRRRVAAMILVTTLSSFWSLTSAENRDAVTAHVARERVVVSDRALAIHRSSVLIDGHNDLPWALRQLGFSSFDKLDIAEPQKRLHTDILRLRRGGVKGQFWSVYVPADTANNGTALLKTLEQIDLVKRMVQYYGDTFELALTADDIQRIHKSGRIASLIGVEGGHCIENSLSVLRRLYQLGARYMTLTHSDTLPWADSATGDANHQGLTAFGEEVVREMNRLGMLVDLSHVSPATMKDALRVTRAPVIFSHSSARAIADHPRNVPDDVLRQMAHNNGVVMVNFYSGFVVPAAAKRSAQRRELRRQLQQQHEDPKRVAAEMKRWESSHPVVNGTIHDVVDHIQHIIRVAGIDHIGIGSDFDGVSALPTQLEDVSTYPYITQELLNRGYGEEQIHKILGGNVMRALRGAERTAAELASSD